MKLYAKITSERASKGQGGNKQINLALYIDDRTNPRYRLFLTKRENDDTDLVLVDMEKPYPNDVYQATIKGKKQKSECQHILRTIVHNKEVCDRCKVILD